MPNYDIQFSVKSTLLIIVMSGWYRMWIDLGRCWRCGLG